METGELKVRDIYPGGSFKRERGARKPRICGVPSEQFRGNQETGAFSVKTRKDRKGRLRRRRPVKKRKGGPYTLGGEMTAREMQRVPRKRSHGEVKSWTTRPDSKARRLTHRGLKLRDT